jgi:hypothetical protein
MARKNFLSMGEAWQKLLCGEIIAACRMTEGCVCYVRHQAQSVGRQLVDSGIGPYRTYSLS